MKLDHRYPKHMQDAGRQRSPAAQFILDFTGDCICAFIGVVTLGALWLLLLGFFG